MLSNPVVTMKFLRLLQLMTRPGISLAGSQVHYILYYGPWQDTVYLDRSAM